MENIQTLIGTRIAEQRKKLKISQTELADKLGKSLRTVQKYESGEIDMPISVLNEISKILNIPMNYLIGYDASHIKLESLSDVLAFIFELDRKKELDFDINIVKTDMEEWNCSLTFDGKNSIAIYNADLCLALETFRDNREALATYWMGYETYDAWQDKTIQRCKGAFLSDKEREILDIMELIKRRNELDKQKLEQMLAAKEAEQKDVDNE